MPTSKPLNIILLGDPGAGKATQAEYLLKQYSMTDIDIGKELRKLWVTNKTFSKKYQASYNRGIITPTVAVRDIFHKKIFATPDTKGILFNGGPKKLAEAKFVHKWLKHLGRQNPVVIYISIPVAETFRRTHSRTEILLGQKKRRDEDSPKAVATRIQTHRKNLSLVTNYFKKHYKFARISGIGTRTEVRSRIQKVIKSYEKDLEQVHKNSGGNNNHRRRR